MNLHKATSAAIFDHWAQEIGSHALKLNNNVIVINVIVIFIIVIGL